MATKPHASAGDYRDLFAALVFPASKVAIVSKGRDRGGVDREVASILSLLPRASYRSLAELQADVRAIYLGRGVPAGSVPV